MSSKELSMDSVDSQAKPSIEYVTPETIAIPTQNYGQTSETLDAALAVRNIDLGASISVFKAMYFGTGSDGNLVINPTDVVALTRDMYYDNLTVNGTLNTGQYKIFVKNKIDGTGVIRILPNDGSDGTNGSAVGIGVSAPGGAGAPKIPAGTIDASVDGVAGGAGAIGGGGNSIGGYGVDGIVSATSYCTGDGPRGGDGGYGDGGRGVAGAAGFTTRGSDYNKVYGLEIIMTLLAYPTFNTSGANILYGPMYSMYKVGGGSSGAGGGGGGISSSLARGGGGGGSGCTGGCVFIAARINAFAGTIQAKGGKGGKGGDGYSATTQNGGGGGGGPGGRGGVFRHICNTNYNLYTLDLSGGIGGLGGKGYNNGVLQGGTNDGIDGPNGPNGVEIYTQI